MTLPDPILPTLDFVERKIAENGGERRRALIALENDDDIVALLVETHTDKILLMFGTPEENRETVTSHKFEIPSLTFDQALVQSWDLIRKGMTQFYTLMASMTKQ